MRLLERRIASVGAERLWRETYLSARRALSNHPRGAARSSGCRASFAFDFVRRLDDDPSRLEIDRRGDLLGERQKQRFAAAFRGDLENVAGPVAADRRDAAKAPPRRVKGVEADQVVVIELVLARVGN